MKIDISTIRENYEKMDDDEIRQIVLSEVKELRPEIIDILKNEIQKRDSLRHLNEFVDIQVQGKNQVQGINHVEVKPIIEKMRSLRCPICSETSTPLNAATISTTSGFIILYTSKKFRFGCPRCLVSSAKKASHITKIFGWLFFPWSISLAIKSLRQNRKYFSLIDQNDLTDDFVSYVERNLSLLKDALKNDRNFQDIIDNPDKFDN